MKNAEDYIFEDEATDLQSDESSAVSNAEQEPNQELDLDDLYSMLSESSTAENPQADIETPVESTSGDVSVLDELQAMYSDLDSSNDESTGVSVMEELEAMYAHSDESAINNTEYSSVNDDEPESENVSALDELEALLTGSQTLDDAVDNESEAFDSSNYDHLFENRTSVLDEIQNLLQSSIEELKAKDSANTDFSMRAFEAEYPTRNELIDLLETKLGQLRMVSDSSDAHGFDEGSSVLDELNALLTGIDSDVIEPVSNEDVEVTSLDEIEKYLSSVSSEDEDTSADETVATSSVLDELESLLTESTNTTESDSPSDILEQLEDMLTEKAVSEDETPDEDDFMTQLESSYLLDSSEEEAVKEPHIEKAPQVDNVPESKPEPKPQPIDMHKIRLEQRSLHNEAYEHEKGGETRYLSIVSMLLLAALVIAVVFWVMPDSTVIEPVQTVESFTPAPLPEKDITSEVAAVAVDIDQPYVSLETDKYEDEPIYDDTVSAAEEVYAEDVYPETETVQEPVQEALSIEQPVQPIAPEASEMPEMKVEDILDETLSVENDKAWLIHLFSYYNQPPLASELQFLKDVGVPYEIKQATVNDGLWYRVQVSKRVDFQVAKQYAEMLKKRYGIKGVWISKYEPEAAEQ